MPQRDSLTGLNNALNIKSRKNESSELPVPLVWRPDLVKIVEYLISKDRSLIDSLDFSPISKQNFAYIDQTIDLYGCTLVSLPNEAWHTSFYRWMNGFWELWVDLFSLEEGTSDLVLVIKVVENDDSYRFEFQSLHVPWSSSAHPIGFTYITPKAPAGHRQH